LFVALFGAVPVSVATFYFAGSGDEGSHLASARWAIQYGLYIALLITAYTLWDQRAVSMRVHSPVLRSRLNNAAAARRLVVHNRSSTNWGAPVAGVSGEKSIYGAL